MAPVFYLSLLLQQKDAGAECLFTAAGPPADAKARPAHREVP